MKGDWSQLVCFGGHATDQHVYLVFPMIISLRLDYHFVVMKIGQVFVQITNIKLTLAKNYNYINIVNVAQDNRIDEKSDIWSHNLLVSKSAGVHVNVILEF